MAKKKLVITEVENLFQNSSRKSMSTKCDMGFRFLEGKNLKLCNEWVESVDGAFKITYYDDFIIPETIPINGDIIASCKSLKSVFIKNKKAQVHKKAFDDDVIINGKPRDYWLPIEGDFLDLQKATTLNFNYTALWNSQNILWIMWKTVTMLYATLSIPCRLPNCSN